MRRLRDHNRSGCEAREHGRQQPKLADVLAALEMEGRPTWSVGMPDDPEKPIRNSLPNVHRSEKISPRIRPSVNFKNIDARKSRRPLHDHTNYYR